MKMPIQWHKNALRSLLDSNASRFQALSKLQADYDSAILEIRIYAQQIAEAERQGKNGFDSEKFLKPKTTTKP